MVEVQVPGNPATRSTPATLAIHELPADWSKALAENGMATVEDAVLSEVDPGRCTLLTGSLAIKICKPHQAMARDRRRGLADEQFMLEHCDGIPGVPRPLRYTATSDYECLVLTRIAGHPLGSVGLDPARFLRLARTLSALSRRGIAHNDLTDRNILLARNGAVGLVDFDQAEQTSPLKAFFRNFLGTDRRNVRIGLLGLCWHRFKARIPESVRVRYRALRRREPMSPQQPIIPATAPVRARKLGAAWRIAAVSDASSPGANVAYYALESDGYRFPGERDWEPRWQMIKTAVDLEGKVVLELGCNMALLSTFALRFEKARQATAVDSSSDILVAAGLVGEAYSVAPNLVHADLGTNVGWRFLGHLEEPDVVFALNVLTWVGSEPSFLKNLSRYRRVVFEGHSSLGQECNRLRNAGFSRVRVVGATERGRVLLVADRD